MDQVQETNSILSTLPQFIQSNDGQKPHQYKIEYIDNEGNLTGARTYPIEQKKIVILSVQSLNQKIAPQTEIPSFNTTNPKQFQDNQVTDASENQIEKQDPHQRKKRPQSNRPPKPMDQSPIQNWFIKQSNDSCKQSQGPQQLDMYNQVNKESIIFDDEVPQDGSKQDKRGCGDVKDGNISDNVAQQWMTITNQQQHNQRPPLNTQQYQSPHIQEPIRTNFHNQQMRNPNQSLQEGQPREMPSKYKKKVCWQHFSGGCPNKECQYSHEKQRMITFIALLPNQDKSRFCWNLFRDRNCTKGEQCEGSHDVNEFKKLIFSFSQSQGPSPQLVQQNDLQNNERRNSSKKMEQ